MWMGRGGRKCLHALDATAASPGGTPRRQRRSYALDPWAQAGAEGRPPARFVRSCPRPLHQAKGAARASHCAQPSAPTSELLPTRARSTPDKGGRTFQMLPGGRSAGQPRQRRAAAWIAAALCRSLLSGGGSQELLATRATPVWAACDWTQRGTTGCRIRGRQGRSRPGRRGRRAGCKSEGEVHIVAMRDLRFCSISGRSFRRACNQDESRFHTSQFHTSPSSSQWQWPPAPYRIRHICQPVAVP